MARKSINQKFQEVIDNSLSVEKAIEILKTFPKDALLGNIGHFGEFNPITKSDLRLTEAYITPDHNWRSKHTKNIQVIEISVENIGPDPD